MAKSTGPMLAVGAISFGNEWLLNKQPPDFKILLGTAIATALLAGAEHVNQEIAVGISWIALITITLTRIGGKPSPADNLLRVTGLGSKT